MATQEKGDTGDEKGDTGDISLIATAMRAK